MTNYYFLMKFGAVSNSVGITGKKTIKGVGGVGVSGLDRLPKKTFLLKW